MDNLERFEFNCPFCQNEFYTYVEKDKLIEFYAREKLIQHIFPGYDPSYREILISKLCNNCQDNIFGNSNNKKYVLPINASATEDEQLKADIIDLIENAKRNN